VTSIGNIHDFEFNENEQKATSLFLGIGKFILLGKANYL
jgi:hypothetical protein